VDAKGFRSYVSKANPVSIGTPGRIRNTVVSGSRKIQLAAKINF
jgi:hypothetical protein